MVMSVTGWPAWSIEREPADLARYVVPDEVARLVRIPDGAGEVALTRLSNAWEALRSVGVGYVPEPRISSASDTSSARQIRNPEQVLGTPPSATCLDMALVLAGACAHARLSSVVLVLDPTHAGEVRHALVAVLLEQAWPGDWQDPSALPEALVGLAAHVRAEVRSPGRDVVVLDPVGLTHSSGIPAIVGTDQSLELAAASGRQFLTGGDWALQLGALARHRSDAFVPEQVSEAGGLAASEEAVASYRELAAADPAAFSPDLAMSLNNLSVQRSAAGDQAGGVSAIEEAVAAYRELAAADPAAYSPDLAMSLNNLSVQRSATGDQAGGVSAIEEAVASYRELAAADPAAFTHHLAMSLNNLSVQRSAARDQAGALSAIEEALASYRELAAADPAAFTADLAMSLNNVSVRRAMAGDQAGGVSAGEEAVASYRELAAADPSAFTPDLASALNNLSVRLGQAFDPAGALSALEEAVSLLFQRTGADHPATLTPDLAGWLNNLSVQRSAAGDLDGALIALEEAANSYRALAEADPAAFTPDLAGSLNNLSNRRAEAGDGTGALTAIEEAVALHRELAAADPATFTPDLAGSLNNLSNRRAEAGDGTGALSAIEEAVALHVELAAADPAAFSAGLAASARLMADQLAQAGHEDGAVGVWDGVRAAVAPPQLRAYVTAANAAWLDQRGDRPQAEARIREGVGEAMDTTSAEQVADGGFSIPDLAVGQSRQYLRSVVLSMNPVPGGLPSWASGPVPDPDLDLARAWGAAATWSAAANVLREGSDVITGPGLSEALDILHVLHPGDQRLTGLAAVHKDVLARGLSQVLADITAKGELQTLVNAWVNTDTWPASFAYLAEHVDRLRSVEVVQQLVTSQNPTALQHAAILTLCETIAPGRVEQLVTDVSVAADLALDAVEAGNLVRVQLLTLANPGAMQLPGTGPMLQAVLLLSAGDEDRAAVAAKLAAQTATDEQRRAHAVRLEHLAEHAEAVEGGAATVTALIGVYTTAVSATSESDAEPGQVKGPQPPVA
jgi:hypothetical protein